MSGWVGKAIATIRQRAVSFRVPGLPRPAQLLLTVTLTLSVALAIDGFTGWHVYYRLFYPAQETPADVQAWSALIYALLLVGGLPVAFLVWHWRDVNVRDQIESARKDINLKEFQEIQLRASGALDEKLPAEAREQLQIAALHQLRTFLRGEYGEAFRRPAFELLLAGHAAAMERIGLPKALDTWRKIKPAADIIRKSVQEAVAKASAKWTAVDRERAGIIRDEWRAVFGRGFPLNGRRFDAITVPPGALLARLNLSGSVFVGADLVGAHLEGAYLRSAHLEGADLVGAHLEGAVLSGAHLEGADLSMAHLEGASLLGAHLEGTNLFMAHLEGANLVGAHLEGANLSGTDWRRARFEPVFPAVFDDATKLLDDWDGADEAGRNAARDELRALGARHVDDPPATAKPGA